MSTWNRTSKMRETFSRAIRNISPSILSKGSPMPNEKIGAQATRMEDMATSDGDPKFATHWLTETPAVNYSLVAVFDTVHMQELHLTLEEFEALKAHIAKMRGYAVQGTMGDD